MLPEGLWKHAWRDDDVKPDDGDKLLMLKCEDQPRADTEREVIRIRQAMQRVQHPLYLHLITTLVDSMTLQIAAVEQAISNGDGEIARPVGRLDG